MNVICSGFRYYCEITLPDSGLNLSPNQQFMHKIIANQVQEGVNCSSD